MFQVPDHDQEFDSADDVIDFLKTLPKTDRVLVEAPAGRYTGVDSIPYHGTVEDVIDDLEMRYNR